MKTIQTIYHWCACHVRRVAGAIAFCLPFPAPLQRQACDLRALPARGKVILVRAIAILSMMLFLCPGIMRVGGGATSKGPPSFTYTGVFTLIDDGDGNWRMKLLTSGTLTLARDTTIDLFLVGGGGGGSGAQPGSYEGSGGAGGRTKTVSSIIAQGKTAYAILVGSGGARGGTSANGSVGGTTIGFSVSASGGEGGYAAGKRGGSGGSGGGSGVAQNGGANGSNGYAGSGYTAGLGQGSTTYEFGHSGSTLYAGGGASAGGAGGAGGGGTSGSQGTDALGGGGAGGIAGGDTTGRDGGDGVFIIRNHRAA